MTAGCDVTMGVGGVTMGCGGVTGDGGGVVGVGCSSGAVMTPFLRRRRYVFDVVLMYRLELGFRTNCPPFFDILAYLVLAI